MKRARPKIFLVIPLVVLVGGALLVARLFITSPHHVADAEKSGAESTAAVEAPNAEPQVLGRVKLAIRVPSEAKLTSVSYAVVNAGHIVVARGNAPVEKQTAIVAAPPIVLPVGKGYTLSVVGNSTDGVKRAAYLGSGAFDVASGHDTPVSFTPNAGGDHATGESAGAVIPAGAATPVDNAIACQSCELSSSQGICASENITATSNTDPRTGDQTGVGWGCGTLADPKARSACLALLHCLNVNGCGHPGENPVTGCYCGAAPAEDCMGGQGITGACIAEYQAAAMASSGGPPSGAGGGQLSQFVATASGDPTTPVGLANNIKHCATETSCDACQTL